jgi:hypothetical protein
VSLAVCKAGAVEKGVPLYRHIADLAGNSEVILPVPVSDLLEQGPGPPEPGDHWVGVHCCSVGWLLQAASYLAALVYPRLSM